MESPQSTSVVSEPFEAVVFCEMRPLYYLYQCELSQYFTYFS